MALGQLIVRMGLDAADFVQGMTAAEAKASRFANGINSNIQSGALLAAGALAALGAAAVGAFKVISEQVETIASFQQLSEKIGDTAENLASLKKASDVSGVSMDSIAAASVKLTAALSKTDEEGKGAAQAIKALGLDFNEFKKLSPVDQIEKLSQSFAKFKTGAERTAAAVALWGKSGAEMIPMLNDLAEGSERHITLTGEQIRAADEFSKALARLSSDAGVLKSQLVAEMIPTLQDLLTAFTESGDNAKDAAGKFGVFSGGLQVVKQFIKDTAIELVTLAEWYQKLSSLAVGYKDVSAALLSGSLTQAREIGAAFRAEFDKTSLKYDALRAKIAAAGDGWRGKNFDDPRIIGSNGGEKPALPFSGAKPKDDKDSKAKKSEADQYLESLQKQLQTVEKLTVNEKLMQDMELGRLGVVTPVQRLELQLLAQKIDATRAQELETKKAADAQKADSEAIVANWKRQDEAMERNARIGEELRQSVMTDQEQINALEDQYAQALDKKIISLETYSRLMDKLKAKTDENAFSFLNLESTAQSAASSLADGLANAIVQGKSLTDVIKNVLKELAAMIIKAIILKALGALADSFVPGSGAVITGVAGQKAAGGPVSGGSTYLVGERGPELFTPSQSGKIITNKDTFGSSSQGGGQQVVYNITAPSVSREEVMAGINSARAAAVSDVRENTKRRRA